MLIEALWHNYNKKLEITRHILIVDTNSMEYYIDTRNYKYEHWVWIWESIL